MDLDEINAIVRRFGAEHQRSVLSEQREKLTSVMFDVPRRSSLGNALFYEHGAGLIRELEAAMTPEAIGKAMKRPGSRPYTLSLWVVMGAYLGGRQQTLLDLGVQPGESVDDPRVEDLVTVVEFYARVARAYREDGGLFPVPGDLNQRILASPTLADVLASAEAPRSGLLAAMRRAAASLTLFNFMQHGEQRDGIFGHGPYRGPNDTIVWFEEFNDLRNDVLPWASLDAEPIPVENVVLVYGAPDVEVEANMFGALRVTPLEFDDRLDLIAAVTRVGDTMVALDEDLLAEVAARADERQALLFETAFSWPTAFRVAYGASLFANHLVPFFDLAGVPDGRALVLDRFAASTAAALAPILSGEVPSFWQHLATVPNDQMYSPARPPRNKKA